MSYPKVLIIGQHFDLISGGGITLSNLFRDWPNDKIAVIPYSYDKSNPLIFSNIYEIKNFEYKYLLFFNRLKNINNNILNEKGNSNHSSSNIYLKILLIIKLFFKKIVRSIVNVTGFSHIKYELVFSNEMRKWVKDFNPDLIYAQFATYDAIKFVSKIKCETKLPLVIHFMDDWPSVIVATGLFQNYWKRIISEELEKLINSANACIGISEKMAKEFRIRYKKEFTYFHNPVEIDKWLPYSKTSWEIGSTFRVLYSGRFGNATIESIKEIADCIQKLNEGNIKLVFHIYTKDFIKAQQLFKKMHAVYVHEPLPAWNQIPQLFCSYDLLIIPIDFYSKFLTLSMPTKVSEYMITGIPILIYAPKDSALAEYALQYEWGYVVNNNDSSEITQAILDIINNESIRRKFGIKAKELAITKHNADVVRSNFRQLLNSKLNYRKEI